MARGSTLRCCLALALLVAAGPAHAYPCPDQASRHPRIYDQFGVSLALSARELMVAASGDDDMAFNGGAVYIYDRTDDLKLVEKIFPDPAVPGTRAGHRLILDGDRLLVLGGVSDGAAARTEFPAWVFVRGRRGWQPEAVLSHPDGEERGRTVNLSYSQGALSGDVLALHSVLTYVYDEWLDSNDEILLYERGPEGWTWQRRIPGARSMALVDGQLLVHDRDSHLITYTRGATGWTDHRSDQALTGNDLRALAGLPPRALLASSRHLTILERDGEWRVEAELELEPPVRYERVLEATAERLLLLVNISPLDLEYRLLTIERGDQAWIPGEPQELPRILASPTGVSLIADRDQLFYGFPFRSETMEVCDTYVGFVEHWRRQGEHWTLAERLTPEPFDPGCRIAPGTAEERSRGSLALLLLGALTRRRRSR